MRDTKGDATPTSWASQHGASPHRQCGTFPSSLHDRHAILSVSHGRGLERYGHHGADRRCLHGLQTPGADSRNAFSIRVFRHFQPNLFIGEIRETVYLAGWWVQGEHEVEDRIDNDRQEACERNFHSIRSVVCFPTSDECPTY